MTREITEPGHPTRRHRFGWLVLALCCLTGALPAQDDSFPQGPDPSTQPYLLDDTQEWQVSDEDFFANEPAAGAESDTTSPLGPVAPTAPLDLSGTNFGGPPPLPPELADPTADLAGIRDIEDIPNPYLPWIIAGVVVAVLALIGLILWWYLRPKPEIPEAVESPFEAANRRLQEARQLLDPATPKPFADAVSEVVRRYLEEGFGLRATAETTEEFLAEAQHSPLFTEESRLRLRQFLEQVDLVKFAGQRLDRAAMEDLFAIASDTVKGLHARESTPEPETATAA